MMYDGAGCWDVDIVHSAILTLPLVCQQGFFCQQDFSKILIMANGI